MPIDLNGQGYNERTTQEKQKWVRQFFEFHLDWARHVMVRNSFFDPYYRYFDFTAGAGRSEEYGDGSPLLHAKAAAAHRAKFDNPLIVRAHLIEEEWDTAWLLEHLTIEEQTLMLCRPHYDSKVHYGDHNVIVPQILQKLMSGAKRHAYTGLAYVDPNGKILPYPLLSEMQKSIPRLDILLHLSATNHKRVQHCFSRDDLVTSLESVGKRHWKVAELGGKHQWAFAFGTNYDKLGDWASLGLYSINSKKGGQILDHLNYTARELEGMPERGQISLWK